MFANLGDSRPAASVESSRLNDCTVLSEIPTTVKYCNSLIVLLQIEVMTSYHDRTVIETQVLRSDLPHRFQSEYSSTNQRISVSGFRLQ